MNHPDDAVLVDKLRDSRDLDAFRELYDRHAAYCYGLARRIVVDPHGAQDVVQEVFAAVWAHPERYDPRRGPFARWLLSVAHHRAVDAVRRSAVRATSQLNTGDHPIVGAAADVALANLEAHRVRVALTRLPDNQRNALELAYWGGCTQREIAEHTNTPVGTVKWWIHDAVKRLGAELRTTTEPHWRSRYG
jgi:RNA polymerase sigma factor (sigma-70 family)